MGFNDPEAANLRPKSRGLVGASMPSRRPDDPRHSRSEAPLLNARIIGDGLRLTNGGKIAVDFDSVEEAAPYTGSDLNVVKVTSAYLALFTDDVILADATSAAFDVDLPPAASVPNKRYYIKRLNGGSNNGRVDPDGDATTGDQIDEDKTKLQLAVQYESVTLVSDGTEWWIL